MYILPPVTTSGNTYVARHIFSDDNSHSDSPTRTSFSPSPTATSSISTANNQPDVVVASSPPKGLAPWIIGLIVALAVIIVAISLFFTGRWYMKRKRAQKINRTNWRWLGRDADLDSNSEKTVAGSDLISHTYETASVRSDSLASRWSYHGPKLTIEDGVSVGNGVSDNGTVCSPSDYSTNVAHKQHSPSCVVNPSLTPLASAAPQLNYSHSLRSTSSSSSSQRSTPRVAVAGPPNDVYTLSNGGDITNSGLSFTLATMQRPFVRSLTDELSASVGQHIGIIQEYNDGWALCVILDEHGMVGGQGMIPSECLNKSPF